MISVLLGPWTFGQRSSMKLTTTTSTVWVGLTTELVRLTHGSSILMIGFVNKCSMQWLVSRGCSIRVHVHDCVLQCFAFLENTVFIFTNLKHADLWIFLNFNYLTWTHSWECEKEVSCSCVAECHVAISIDESPLFVLCRNIIFVVNMKHSAIPIIIFWLSNIAKC